MHTCDIDIISTCIELVSSPDPWGLGTRLVLNMNIDYHVTLERKGVEFHTKVVKLEAPWQVGGNPVIKYQ